MDPWFLMIFEKFHQNNIKHYFLSFEDETSEGLIYCQQFKIGGRQIKGYQKKNNIRKRVNSFLLVFVEKLISKRISLSPFFWFYKRQNWS